MPTISEVLNRRTDLSTFLVHLTRVAPDGKTAAQNLFEMYRDGRIEARRALGWAKRAAATLGGAAEASQRVACFSETPLDQIYSLVADIEGRSVALEPYGLAFTKMVARRKGVNPVWYVDMSIGHTWHIRDALNAMLSEAVARGRDGFPDHPAAHVFPFCERMGTWEGGQHEFWWEREWRHVGHFEFERREVALLILPEQYHDALRDAGVKRPLIDATWGMERMVASLAGLDRSDVTPFTA